MSKATSGAGLPRETKRSAEGGDVDKGSRLLPPPAVSQLRYESFEANQASAAAGRGQPRRSSTSRARSRRASGERTSGTMAGSSQRDPSAVARRSATTTEASIDQACPGERAPTLPAAATSAGDGVSPAATAARSGSPPGSAAITRCAEAGRSWGPSSMQRRITFSTAGSISRCTLEGGVLPTEWAARISCRLRPPKTCLPVNIS